MSGGFGAHGHGHEDVDADAVCAQCGEVNPEGTLICKTCGNNLRDQRAIRMTAEQVLDGGADAGENRRVIMQGLLSVMGILLVLLVTLNVNGLSSWLVNVQNSDVATVRALWKGENSGVYASLLSELDALQVNEQTLESSRLSPGQNTNGVHAIFVNERLIAAAMVELDGDVLYFVARMLESDTEFRGRAEVSSGAFAVFEGGAGIRLNGEMMGTMGLARLRNDGGYECIGQLMQTERDFRFESFPVGTL